MKQAIEPVQASGVTMTVASTVIRVAELDRSVNFYCDVFCCRVALRDSDTALLLTPDGFQIYLHSQGPSRRPRLAPIGIQYLMWATDSPAELERVSSRLRAHDSATYAYTENGVTFVEGCDPDHGRVIVAFPSPGRLPRELIASRLRGVVRPGTGAGTTPHANTSPAQRH
jgi:catechol 2,3-dioxygenase-like lactoylglutathione lyase family enzyme